jgi:predicted DNA binding protein
MRYLTVLVHPDQGGAFHPLGKKLTNEPSIERKAIHHVELLTDNTVLLFAEGSGDKERYKEIMGNSPHVTDYLVSGGNRWMAVSQFTPTDTARRALELQRDSDIVIDMPIRFTTDGAFRTTYIGDDKSFQELFQNVGKEESVAFEVVETGDYDPNGSLFTRLLTTRQREVLRTAVEMGYYKVPREATLEDIAEAVGIVPTTASEHLRKVEERVFGTLVQ